MANDDENNEGREAECFDCGAIFTIDDDKPTSEVECPECGSTTQVVERRLG